MPQVECIRTEDVMPHCSRRSSWSSVAVLLLALCWQQATALVELPETEVDALAVNPPVTNWLMPPAADQQLPPLQRVAWQKIGE